MSDVWRHASLKTEKGDEIAEMAGARKAYS
jgi:hypothetical protein